MNIGVSAEGPESPLGGERAIDPDDFVVATIPQPSVGQIRFVDLLPFTYQFDVLPASIDNQVEVLSTDATSGGPSCRYEFKENRKSKDKQSMRLPNVSVVRRAS